MNIVIPMAGLGKRFLDAGYKQIKPLINVIDKPMYAWATDSLPLEKSTKLIFILLANQPEVEKLRDDIKKRYKKYNTIIHFIQKLTRGQSETVLSVRELINNKIPLIIHNADTAFTISDYWLKHIESTKPDGALLVFKSKEKRWSFSKENSRGLVVEVREKKPISNFASTGTYYFGKGEEFVLIAENRIKNNKVENGEYYVAPIYNDLISKGGIVRNYLVKDIYCFGTPKDLDLSLKLLKPNND